MLLVAHCNTRVTRDVKCIRTYLGPGCLWLSVAVPYGLGSRRLAERTWRSLHRLRVAMHNPRLDHPPRSAGGLTSALTPVSSPRRIELNRMFQVMYGTPPTLLSFTLAGILSKRLEDYAFALAFPYGTACEQGLLPGLQRSLIVIATPALVLSHGDTARRALSPQVVLQGSMNSTSRPAILPPSECSCLLGGAARVLP